MFLFYRKKTGGTMKYLIIMSFFLFLSFNCTESRDEAVENVSLKAEEVNYSANGTNLKGYLVYDENRTDPGPGVIVVHEWWGHNEYARKRAEMLAELGYTAFAIDMFGDGKQAHHPDDAGKFAGEVMKNMNSAKVRFDAGVNYLKNQSVTDSENIAAVGYCFGGGVVLNMALAGSDIDGAVSFHGSLPTGSGTNPDLVLAKILVLNGEDDPMVPQEQVDAFKKAMDSADVDYKFINYPGAVHAFTNPAADSLGKEFNIPIAYNKEADEKSWEEMKRFLEEVFSE